MDPLGRLHSKPFATRDALGLVTPDVLRGPRYRRLMRGAYQPAGTGTAHGRLVQAFRARHGDDLVLLGRSAAWAHGACSASATDPVCVAMATAHQLRTTAEVHPLVATLRPDDVVRTPLGAATSRARTAYDLARGTGAPGRGLVDRVADVDALLRATGLTAEAARLGAVSWPGLRGARAAREALDLCRDGVDSPPETRLRLLLRAGGLPEPVTQCPVLAADGRTVARLDLGWPALRAGCEYDGQVHGTPEQVRVDLRRHNGIREADWVVLQVDRHQMRRPEEVVAQARRLVAARQALVTTGRDRFAALGGA